MMRALVRLTLGLVAVLAAVPATAGKIGFLNAERAVVTVREGKSGLQAIEEWARARRSHIEQIQTQVNELDERLTTQRGTLSADELARLERELIQAQRALEDEARGFNREVAARREQILGDVGAKIGTVAGEYAEANDFEAIFLLGTNTVAYHSKALDITDIIIRLYDERYPVAGGS